MADQTLTCTDCGTQFQFTESEQEFYQSKGYTAPSRCAGCRAARKAAREGSNGGYGSAARYGERQMYPVVCAQCGKDTQVPFQPRGDKPVYCSDCYRLQPGNNSNASRTHSSSGSGRY